MVTSDFSQEVKIRPFRACAMKICNIALIYGRIAEMFASFRKSGSRNTMVTSDFSPEVEIGRFAHVQCIRPQLLEQFVHYGGGYGADTTFHRTHF